MMLEHRRDCLGPNSPRAPGLRGLPFLHELLHTLAGRCSLPPPGAQHLEVSGLAGEPRAMTSPSALGLGRPPPPPPQRKRKRQRKTIKIRWLSFWFPHPQRLTHHGTGVPKVGKCAGMPRRSLGQCGESISNLFPKRAVAKSPDLLRREPGSILELGQRFPAALRKWLANIFHQL